MQKFIKALTYLSALQSLLPFLKPSDRSIKTLLWIPKLIAGAIAPFNAIICGLGAFVGLLRRDWKLASLGLIGAGLAAKFIEEVPDTQAQFEAAFGSNWEQQIPEKLAPHIMPVRFSLPARTPENFKLQQNIVIGRSPQNGKDLLADLWLPASETQRSKLSLIYAHGSGWRVGDKDMGTRPFFQRLASQGHVILDVAYTLWPAAGIPTMVTEINLATLWMKKHAPSYEINPKKIVLIGGSAGAHLVLLAAYAPDKVAFQPAGENIDTTVCGVVAYYPPVDLLAMQTRLEEYTTQSTPKLVEKAADKMIQTLFQIDNSPSDDGSRQDMIAELLGGTATEIPETYRLLSPIYHAGENCPPTMLLQGADDVFELAVGVRNLQTKLKEANVPVVCVEFPHTEHAFDLFFPQISPVAQAATYDVERFLAMLV